jgi:hypothetical protein
MPAALQSVPGLLKAARQLREQAEWNRTKAKAAKTDPRLAHEAECSAKADEARAGQLERHASCNIADVNALEFLIHTLKTSPHQSAYRTLALGDLESASSWLRRELGDTPN